MCCSVNVNPSLAERYEELRYKTYRQIGAQEGAIRDTMFKGQREATRPINDCIEEIRKCHTQERFLLEHTVEELKDAASLVLLSQSMSLTSVLALGL